MSPTKTDDVEALHHIHTPFISRSADYPKQNSKHIPVLSFNSRRELSTMGVCDLVGCYAGTMLATLHLCDRNADWWSVSKRPRPQHRSSRVQGARLAEVGTQK